MGVTPAETGARAMGMKIHHDRGRRRSALGHGTMHIGANRPALLIHTLGLPRIAFAAIERSCECIADGLSSGIANAEQDSRCMGYAATSVGESISRAQTSACIPLVAACLTRLMPHMLRPIIGVMLTRTSFEPG